MVFLALGPDGALGDSRVPEKQRWVTSPEPMVNSSSLERINDRKRSVAVDLGGLLVAAVVSGAGVQDRDTARDPLATLRIEHPQVPTVWADGACRGEPVSWAANTWVTRGHCS